MDLARPAGAHHASAVAAGPYYVLVGLVVATGLWQQRQLAARRSAPEGAGAPAPGSGMIRMMPAFLGFISLSMPAGVVLYFAVSNLWQIAQQAVLFRGGNPPA